MEGLVMEKPFKSVKGPAEGTASQDTFEIRTMVDEARDG